MSENENQDAAQTPRPDPIKRPLCHSIITVDGRMLHVLEANIPGTVVLVADPEGPIHLDAVGLGYLQLAALRVMNDDQRVTVTT